MNTDNNLIPATTRGLLADYLEARAAARETPKGGLSWSMPDAVTSARALRQIAQRIRLTSRGDGDLNSIQAWIDRHGPGYVPGKHAERFLQSVGTNPDPYDDEPAGDAHVVVSIPGAISEWVYHTLQDFIAEADATRREVDDRLRQINAEHVGHAHLHARIAALESASDSYVAGQIEANQRLKEALAENEPLRAQVTALRALNDNLAAELQAQGRDPQPKPRTARKTKAAA